MKETGKINYIEMPSADLTATKTFFASTFGWTFTHYGPDYLAIANAGIDGGFYLSNVSATTENGSVLVVLFSANLEQTLGKIKLSGGKILKEIFSFPGGRRFHFADPNGNEYAVWSDIE